LQRIAFQAATESGAAVRPQYRLTLESLRAAQNDGLDEVGLDAWFRRRTGQALPAAARLLLTAERASPVELGPRLIMRVGSEEIADGLAAWPETAGLVGERLAATVFAVPDAAAELLRERLNRLGVRWE
jgi:hypothetical protein